jgi:hypothetical protein
VAVTKAISISGDVDWVSGGRKPSQTEIISVYGGKSTYYEKSKILQRVKSYPEMVVWLERTESDMEVTAGLWGFYKIIFLVKDLEKWLDRKNAEAEKGREKGKGKKKVAESSTPVKKLHKKSGSGRKQ